MEHSAVLLTCIKWEHSAVLLTCIKIPYGFQTFILSIIEWPIKTGFTQSDCKQITPSASFSEFNSVGENYVLLHVHVNILQGCFINNSWYFKSLRALILQFLKQIIYLMNIIYCELLLSLIGIGRICKPLAKAKLSPCLQL